MKDKDRIMNTKQLKREDWMPLDSMFAYLFRQSNRILEVYRKSNNKCGYEYLGRGDKKWQLPFIHLSCEDLLNNPNVYPLEPLDAPQEITFDNLVALAKEGKLIWVVNTIDKTHRKVEEFYPNHFVLGTTTYSYEEAKTIKMELVTEIR